MLPCVIHAAMRQDVFTSYRQRLIPKATGIVLEIGVGSGLNLPFYSRRVARVVGVDPSSRLLSRAREAATRTSVEIQLLECSAEAIPVETCSVDSVVTTWTLCTIPDVVRALHEMHRVLKPAGRLLFVEHGRSPEPRVCRWQDRLTPLWKHFAGGCHLNRAITGSIEAAGFHIIATSTGYTAGPKLITYTYEGCATKPQ
jgi:ubiquinone/menaquinone biosynthesis C-methylase UbiE